MCRVQTLGICSLVCRMVIWRCLLQGRWCHLMPRTLILTTLLTLQIFKAWHQWDTWIRCRLCPQIKTALTMAWGGCFHQEFNLAWTLAWTLILDCNKTGISLILACQELICLNPCHRQVQNFEQSPNSKQMLYCIFLITLFISVVFLISVSLAAISWV